MHGHRMMARTLNLRMLSLIGLAIDSSIFSDTRPSNGKGSGLTRGLIRAYLSGKHSLRPTLSHVET